MNPLEPSPAPLQRWMDAFVALPARLKFPLAVVLAVLAHLLLLFFIWVAPMFLQLLRIPELLPKSCSNKPPITPTPTPTPTPAPKKLELASMEVRDRLQVPQDPAQPPPPPPPDGQAPLTAAQEQELQKLFEQLPKEEQQEYVDVEGLARKKNLSKRALFESWRDSVAGAGKPGNSNSPLPGQDGRTDIPFAGFKNQQANTTDPKSFEEDSASKPVPTVKFPGLEAPPIYRPRPVQKTDLTQNAKPKTPTAVAAPTPPPPPPASAQDATEADLITRAKKVEEDKPTKYVALGDKDVPIFLLGFTTPKSMRSAAVTIVSPTPPPKAKPTPAPTASTPPPKPPQPPQPPQPTPPPVTVAKMTTEQSKPTPVKTPNYASHMETKKTEGGGPPGEAGVDAIATQRGKYKKMMKMMVESRWLPAVRNRGDLIREGTVAIHFAIDGTGKLTKFKVDYNTSNNAHAMVVEEAMRATKFEPPPPEMLRGGVFEDEFTFTLY